MEFIWEYVVSSDWDMPLKVPHACLAVPSLQRQRWALPPFRWVDEMASSSSSFINPTLKAPKTNSSSGKQTQVYSPPPVSQSIVLHHSCCFLCSDIALDTSSLLPALAVLGLLVLMAGTMVFRFLPSGLWPQGGPHFKITRNSVRTFSATPFTQTGRSMGNLEDVVEFQFPTS